MIPPLARLGRREPSHGAHRFTLPISAAIARQPAGRPGAAAPPRLGLPGWLQCPPIETGGL